MYNVRIRTVALAMSAVAAVGVLGGCTSGSSAAPASTPSGHVETIRPLASIDGATTKVVDGIAIAVPPGVQSELDGGVTQLVLTETGAPRGDAYLTVTAQDKVTDNDVRASSAVGAARIGAALTGVTTTSADWQGFGPAVVVRGTLPAGNRDVMLVTTRDPAGTRIVGIAAEAAEGQLDDSLGDQILRTTHVAK